MKDEKVNLPVPYIKNIGFFGDSGISSDSKLYKEAYEVAEILAKKGFTVVNGGGPGVMDAATKGAEAVGGATLAVTFYPKDAPGFEGRYAGNRVDKEIKTNNYIARMFKLLEHSDMFIIFKGGSGTLSEFSTAWVLAKLYYRHHKPFILYGEFWHEIIECLKKNMNLDKYELDVFEIVTKKEDVLPTIEKLEKDISEHDHSLCNVCKGEECAFIK